MEQKRRRGFPQTEKGGVFLFSLEHSSAQKNPGGEPFDPFRKKTKYIKIEQEEE